MADTLEPRVRQRLAEWRTAGLLRTPHPPSGIDFCSNDYLALSTHPHIVERFADAVRREGAGSTGSRLLRGDREAFRGVEARFAAFKGTERALYFSSGYLANLAVMTTMTERGDVVFSDERNHASVIDGLRLSAATRVVFPHGDVTALASLLATPCPGQRFVVVESLYSMDGDFAPLGDYAELCRRSGASLIVDEAHAVGVYGASGSGLIEACGVGADVCLSVNTAGKALGVSGAFINGPAWAVDYLIQRARPFVFSTAAPPALAAALEASLDVVADEPDRRERVMARARQLRQRLSRAGIIDARDPTQIISLVIGDNDRAVAVAQMLQADGFDVRAIRPPSVPDGTARLRISVNAGLSEAIVDEFAGALVGALKGGWGLLRGIFVTGTDTNVGKTVVSSGLMHRYRASVPRYWKPVQTGIEHDDDSAEVARLSQCGRSRILEEGIRLPRPVSPHLAARLEGIEIEIDKLAEIATAHDDRRGWIVEGAGGVLVPLNQRSLVIDLIARLGLPAVLAVRSGLGTINHTLLTIEALERRSIPVAGVVMVGEPNPENRAAIECYGRVPVIGELPPLDPLGHESLAAWSDRSLDSAGYLKEFLG